jgi:phosphatidylinositol-3-phosphatase
MMRRSSSMRLTRSQLAIVAAISAAATALILVAATGRTAAQSAALAALHHRQVVVQGGGGSSADSASASEPELSSGSTPSAAASASTQTASASSDQATGDTGAGPATTTTTTTTTPTTPSTPKKLPVDHVFVIGLSTTSYDAAFGSGSVAHYLNHTLKPQGTLLGGYQSLGRTSLPDYLALISGQPANADTESGCPTYADFPSDAKLAADGTVAADGCVYPNTVLTIGDQVTAAGHVWKAYVDDLGSTACPHPDSGAVDDAQPRGAGALYDGRHNPFIYFHSLLDLGGCASNDVSLTQLPRDLRKSSTTPTYAYLAPDSCAEASAVSCPGGGKVGLAAEDAFLKRWVPEITRSAAYKQGGAILITFAPPLGTIGTKPTTNEPIPTGALVLSRFTPKDQILSTIYDPDSVLRVTDDLLGLKPLGLAAKAKSFVAKAFHSS